MKPTEEFEKHALESHVQVIITILIDVLIIILIFIVVDIVTLIIDGVDLRFLKSTDHWSNIFEVFIIHINLHVRIGEQRLKSGILEDRWCVLKSKKSWVISNFLRSKELLWSHRFSLISASFSTMARRSPPEVSSLDLDWQWVQSKRRSSMRMTFIRRSTLPVEVHDFVPVWDRFSRAVFSYDIQQRQRVQPPISPKDIEWFQQDFTSLERLLDCKVEYPWSNHACTHEEGRNRSDATNQVSRVLSTWGICNRHRLASNERENDADNTKNIQTTVKPVSAGFSSNSSVILSRNVHHFGALPSVYKSTVSEKNPFEREITYGDVVNEDFRWIVG